MVYSKGTAMRKMYRLLSLLGLVRAASKGPVALAKNRARVAAHRRLALWLRKLLP